MGYEAHYDGLWWPTYDSDNWHAEDFKHSVWPRHIHKQWERLGRKLFTSPDGSRTKVTA